MISNDKWTFFKIVGDYNADIKTLYDAWSTSKGIEKWFLRTADFYRAAEKLKPAEHVNAGDTYQWFWHGWDDSVSENGMILEANGVDFIKFTFTGGCIVSVSLTIRDEITMITLTQENIPEEDNPQKSLFVQCQTGWTFYLTNLKSVIEGGLDLRNKRLDLNSNFK
ncbi:MAG: SRPBCC family protein [Mucilaginibacter sp.]